MVDGETTMDNGGPSRTCNVSQGVKKFVAESQDKPGRNHSRVPHTGIFIGTLALLLAWQPRSHASAPTEYEVKAAYLYNFGLFVHWQAPDAAGRERPFSICVLGTDPFGKALDATIAGETIGAQSVVAHRIVNDAEASECRVLLISSSEDTALKTILDDVGRASILTVSDMPEFVNRGGIIQFVIENSRVRFEINLAAAERAHLTLSSQLLKLAVRVRGPSGLEIHP